MLERVKEAIMVHQTNQQAIRFGMAAAHLLEAILLGCTLKQALEKVIEKAISGGYDDVMDACIRALSAAKIKTIEELMQDMTNEELGGRSCHLPSAFIVPMFLFYQAVADGEAVANGEITEEAYIKALRANILAAGDTCSRGVFIGAVLAAAAGKVPESWTEKLNKDVLAKVDVATAGILEAV